MPDRDRVIEWVRSLLNKTTDQDCTEEEATSAAERVSYLMLKYGLTDEDINPKTASSDVEQRVITMQNFQRWHVGLVQAIGASLFCRTLEFSGGAVLVGRPENVEAARELAMWILRVVERLSTEATIKYQPVSRPYVEPDVYHVSYASGMTVRISERLRLRRERAERAEREGRLDKELGALPAPYESVIVRTIQTLATLREEENLGYINERWPGAGNAPGIDRDQLARNAYYDGWVEGEKVPLDKPCGELTQEDYRSMFADSP